MSRLQLKSISNTDPYVGAAHKSAVKLGKENNYAKCGCSAYDKETGKCADTAQPCNMCFIDK